MAAHSAGLLRLYWWRAAQPPQARTNKGRLVPSAAEVSMARTILVSVILVAGCLTSVTARQAAPTNVRIMAGLNNPRGLALGPNGAVYVAEAGAGGAGPCRVAPTNETRCFGLTGAISRFFNGTQARIITGLPSHALPSG